MSISPIRCDAPYAGQHTSTNAEESLKIATLEQDWPTTLNLLNSHDFETYPPSTLMQVIHKADRKERERLFEKFFQNGKKSFTLDLPPNVRNSVNYISKGPDWGIALFNCARNGLISHIQLIFENTGFFL